MTKRNRRRNAFPSQRTRRTQFEALEPRCVLSATPTLAPIADITLYEGAPINLPLDAIYDLEGPLTYTIECSDPNLTAYVPEGNRSMKISVTAENGTVTGELICELFEQRAPRVTNQIISLAESGFYDGLTFHRIIDDFMIQGGDPLGDGTGGSYLGDFDDQFNLELMHTTAGVLSMAKSVDDSNDSQFFITEVATRNLDFNHSVFGQLVEGYDLLETLSSVETDANDKPLSDVVMQSVEIFTDTENAILVLNAPEGYTGSSTVTITVTIHDQQGNSYVQTPIHVTIQEDSTNSEPFFNDLPTLRTTVDTACSFDLSPYVQDAEGLEPFTTPASEDDIDYEHRSLFLEAYGLNYYDEYVPYLPDTALGYDIDFYTGVATFEPTGGLVGTYPFTVATGVTLGSLDMQVAALNLVPEEAPAAWLEMTLVTEPTAVDGQGEVDSLPADTDWVNAWETCSLEVWAKIDDSGQFGIYSVETDLSFDPEQYQVTDIEWSVAFSQEQTGTIDNVNGTITGLGGTTKWYTVLPYGGADEVYPSTGKDDLVMWGDNRYVLVARVDLKPVADSDTMTIQPGVGYNTAIASDFSLSQGEVKWNAVDAAQVTLDSAIGTDIWAIPYDIDGNAKIELQDVLRFLSYFHVDIDTPSNQWGHACDFNRDGEVDLNDLLPMLSFFQYSAEDGRPVTLPSSIPPASDASQSASLQGTLTASDLVAYFAAENQDDDDEEDGDQLAAIDQVMLFYDEA